jgi:hypothetical protein
VQLKAANTSNTVQRILAVTASDTNDILLAVGVCANANTLVVQWPNQDTMNCLVTIDAAPTTFYLIYNSVYGMYQIYKNGVSVIVNATPALTRNLPDQISVITSANDEPVINGQLTNIALLTANLVPIQNTDVDAALAYLNQPSSCTYTATNSYLLLDAVPLTVAPNLMLTCSPSSKESCRGAQMGKNLGIAFTVQLKTPNTTDSVQRLLGIVAFGTMNLMMVVGVCANSNNLYVQWPNGATEDCSIPINNAPTTFYLLYNGTEGTAYIYKNGTLMGERNTTAISGILPAQISVITTMNGEAIANGQLFNMALMTSNSSSIKNTDMDAIINYVTN